jgi:hypothetical protein
MSEEWQKIETAPRDGTTILVYSPSTFDGDEEVVICCALYDRRDFHPWKVDDGRNLPKLWVFPTHWRPLPEPPITHTK